MTPRPSITLTLSKILLKSDKKDRNQERLKTKQNIEIVKTL